MLNAQFTRKIIDLVSQKPRTVQEIAHTIQKNWRTADSYVDRISRETGTIATRVFRGGTRGALKIVYYNAPHAVRGSSVQEHLFQKIRSTKDKTLFTPMDIYHLAQENLGEKN